MLTSREKALVTLLAQGHTDASAARELGVSPRSVTYTLRALMDRLGVDNRFQLGLALGAQSMASIPGCTDGTPQAQAQDQTEAQAQVDDEPAP
jgi:DNA-binding CsgD family transcriptional regulator